MSVTRVKLTAVSRTLISVPPLNRRPECPDHRRGVMSAFPVTVATVILGVSESDLLHGLYASPQRCTNDTAEDVFSLGSAVVALLVWT